MTYAELVTRLGNYLQAEAKILQSQEYQVGQGGGQRRNRRAELDGVRDEIRKLNADIAVHPDNPANARSRRVRYLRPMG